VPGSWAAGEPHPVTGHAVSPGVKQGASSQATGRAEGTHEGQKAAVQVDLHHWAIACYNLKLKKTPYVFVHIYQVSYCPR